MSQDQIVIIHREELQDIISKEVGRQLEAVLQSAFEKIESTKRSGEEYLTRSDASKFLHCSLVSLWQYEKRGLLKPLRMGRKLLYSKSQLIEVMSK